MIFHGDQKAWVKNAQYLQKVAQKYFQYKNERFWHHFKNCSNLGLKILATGIKKSPNTIKQIAQSGHTVKVFPTVPNLLKSVNEKWIISPFYDLNVAAQSSIFGRPQFDGGKVSTKTAAASQTVGNQF